MGGNELLKFIQSFLCHSINIFMTADEVRLTSLQVIVSSFLVLSPSHFFFFFFFFFEEEKYCQHRIYIYYWPGAFNSRMWILRSAKRHANFCLKARRCGRKQSERAIESETLAPAAVYLEESLRPFGPDILVATGIQFCEYLHWATRVEAMLWGHGQAGATGHHSLNTVPWVCLLLRCLLSYMTTAVFAHAWICNRSKYDVMCGTEWHHAGTRVFILSYEDFFFFF